MKKVFKELLNGEILPVIGRTPRHYKGLLWLDLNPRQEPGIHRDIGIILERPIDYGNRCTSMLRFSFKDEKIHPMLEQEVFVSTDIGEKKLKNGVDRIDIRCIRASVPHLIDFISKCGVW